MRVVCPSCTAAYDVPDAALGIGAKRLRCARCKQEWTVDAAAPQAGDILEPTSAPDLPGPTDRMAGSDLTGKAAFSALSSTNDEAADAPVKPSLGLFAESPIGTQASARPSKLPSFDGRLATQPRRAAAGSVVLAWVLSLAVLGLCGAAAVIWRTDVMRAWPPSERAYVALGLR